MCNPLERARERERYAKELAISVTLMSSKKLYARRLCCIVIVVVVVVRLQLCIIRAKMLFFSFSYMGMEINERGA